MSATDSDPDDGEPNEVQQLQARVDALHKKLNHAIDRIDALEDTISFSTASLDSGDTYDQKAAALLLEREGNEATISQEDIGKAYRAVGIRDRQKIRERVGTFTDRYCEDEGFGNYRLEIGPEA